MTSLRDAASGKPCMIRIPGICNGDPDTVDGRVQTDLYTRNELRLMHAEGCFRTQEALRRAA